jgi:uncharacterized protein
MTFTKYPLLDLFTRLRQRHDFSIGIEEYILALQALRAGFGIGDIQALEDLCCTLWAKSDEESYRLRRVLREMLTTSDSYADRFSVSKSMQALQEDSQAFPFQETLQGLSQSSSSPKEPKSEQLKSEQSLPSTSGTAPSPTPATLGAEPQSLPELGEPVQVVQAVRHYQRSSSTISYSHAGSLTEYFPVTRRQMKQSWRQLRRLVREGPPQDLDVPATITKFCREGVLLKPVLVQRRLNRAELAFLIDQGGSMIPFHRLSQQLIETAERGGRLKQTRVYYFHNYPDRFLYTDPSRIKAQPIADVLEEVGEKTAVFIISDAGAARGNYDLDRLEYTQAFLKQLRQSIRYFVWLNPMPSNSWLHTTAAAIARLVPMFEMSREGLNDSIDILQGRYISWEKMYAWML